MACLSYLCSVGGGVLGADEEAELEDDALPPVAPTSSVDFFTPK